MTRSPAASASTRSAAELETNQIAFDRSRDTDINGGGSDVVRSSLDVSAGSPILAVSWQSSVGSMIATGMLTPISGPLSWTAIVTNPQSGTDGPVVTAVSSSLSATLHQSFAASSLFTVHDPLGDPIVQYDLWNAGTGGGHFVVNGVVQATQQTFIVTAAQLAQTTYVAGSGSDVVRIQAYDGIQFGPWQAMTINSAPSTPITPSGPASVVPHNQAVGYNQTLALTSIFSVSGSGITQYQVWFSHPEGGNPALGVVTNNNAPIALDQPVTVTGLG